jgi:hypothetical protein
MGVACCCGKQDYYAAHGAPRKLAQREMAGIAATMTGF